MEFPAKKKGGCKIILCFQSRRPPLNGCFFFKKKKNIKWPPKVSKGHFSNLTSKNDVLYFPSNLMELTNGVAKMQLFGSLGGYFITFGTSGG
jgi:hypothetical protein